MSRLICWLRGWTPVRKVGIVARPGGMLPVLDGLVAYEPHPDGDARACLRCRLVAPTPPVRDRAADTEGPR